MKLFNHVQVKVKDLKRSRQFYDIVMAALGYKNATIWLARLDKKS